MKKRVLFFIESLRCGGAEKSIVSLLPLLDYRKMDVDLMLLQRGGIFEKYIPKEVNIIDFHFQYHPLWFRFCQTLFSLRLRWLKLTGRSEHGAETRWRLMHGAYRRMEQNYDVAIAYQQGFPTYYVAEKVDAKNKIAWVNVDLTKAGYKPTYNNPFYQQFNKVVAVSDNLKQLITQEGYVGTDKVEVVRDILNVDFIRTMSQQYLPFARTSNLKIVTVGRMVYQKGYDIAVETAALLHERGVDFRWYFVGDGSMRPEIERLIHAKRLGSMIVLTGEQENPYPYMAAADIYVQTSRFEGFGLTIAEAKILGKPVVSTCFPVVFNQIKDGKNGLIADMNPKDIVDKICAYIHHPILREEIRKNLSTEVDTTAITESKKVNQLILMKDSVCQTMDA